MDSLKFYSTNRKAPKVGFREALLKGQAPDKGLYMPEVIPTISLDEIRSFFRMSYPEIAFAVTSRFLQGEIPNDILKDIVEDAYDYEVPLERVRERKYVMRLDQGPTASFKDFAARMMGRLMQYYLKLEERRLIILTATSGDTGSAVANAFYGLDNIDVVVLFPEKEVTPRQRKQMTTLGKNVTVISLDAKFDDCQALVKQAFADPDLAHLPLSSANSINIGRLVPQIVYYFYAYAKLMDKSIHLGKKDLNAIDPVIFSVPSGNFGDMMGGVLGMKMGLPVSRFVIATNENDEFPVYLQTGKYQKIVPSRNCISSAMNVGHPSNLARLVTLYGGEMDEVGVLYKQARMDLMQEEIWSVSISDEETRNTIAETYRHDGVLLEPHGAVGWAGLMQFLNAFPHLDTPEQLCISLETAHPAKFPEEIERILEIEPDLPPSLEGIDGLKEHIVKMGNSYPEFKAKLLDWE